MKITVEPTLPAWEPLTPRGVAAFARSKFSRLLLVQLFVASIVAGVVVWFVQGAWFPTVKEAMVQLPASGEIRGGQLQWPAASPVRLAEGRFIGFGVDLDRQGELGRAAHAHVEFGRSDIRVFSLLGFITVPYPRNWVVAFNRQELVPWWGAWEPAILAVLAIVTVICMMAAWSVLAAVYSGAVWGVAFFQNREITWAGSWRLAGAALMPGALFMSAVIVLYGMNAIDMIRLLLAAVLHVVVGWIYAGVSPLFLPRSHQAQRETANPFQTSADRRQNPFSADTPAKPAAAARVDGGVSHGKPAE